jgi:cellulose synthase (UDP-forming)
MQVLRKENPLFVSGLTLPQRLSYAATLLGWFDAWRSLGYLLLPAAVLLTGAVPIRADALTFSVFFATTFTLQQVALRLLSRGCHRPVLSIVFEFVRMTPNLLATLSLVTRRKVSFRVTPKGRVGDGRRRAGEPRLLRLLVILNLYAAAWFALVAVGVAPLHYTAPWAAYGAFGWLVVNVTLLFLAIARVRSLRYAGERRASTRFETAFAGTLDGEPCDVDDLSLTGARVAVPRLTARDGHVLAVHVPSEVGPIELRAVVRSSRADENGRTTLGLEFLPDQNVERARLALALFHTTVVPARDGEVGTRVITTAASGRVAEPTAA